MENVRLFYKNFEIEKKKENTPKTIYLIVQV